MAEQTLSVDGSPIPWVSIAELARVKKISRQAASKRIKRLEAEGLLSTRMNGQLREVDLAEYDRVVGQVGNAFKEQSAATKREEPEANSPKLRDAQADKANYEARLKALDYAERIGTVVPRRGPKGVETAVIKITEKLLRVFGSPMEWVPEIMEAARKGEPELRRLLRTKIRENREHASNVLLALAGSADEDDATNGVQIDIDFDD